MAPNIEWEKDPLTFVFKDEVKEKVKMHTRRLQWNDWIRIDNTYIDQMKLRYELLKSKFDIVYASKPSTETEEAKWELFETLVEFLPGRFPDIFEDQGDWIYNKALDDKISKLKTDPECPLIRASKLVQEDLCVLEYSEEDEAYILTAGIVYFPMRWFLQEKFLKPIAIIHKPVPAVTNHLVPNIYSLFLKMTPNAPVWRANWILMNFLKGPLDLHIPESHELSDSYGEDKPSVYMGEQTGRDLMLRVEYQTLRKLPKTKAIIFTIRTYQRYLEEFQHLPASDSLALIKAIEESHPDHYGYRGMKYWDKVAIKYLQMTLAKRAGQDKLKKLVSFGAVVGVVAVAGIALVRYLKKN